MSRDLSSHPWKERTSAGLVSSLMYLFFQEVELSLETELMFGERATNIVSVLALLLACTQR
jgi:hypothetical protein